VLRLLGLEELLRIASQQRLDWLTTAFSKDSRQNTKKWMKLRYLAKLSESLAPCPLRDCAPEPNLPFNTLSACKQTRG